MDSDFLAFPAQFTWKGNTFDCLLQVRPHNIEYNVIIGGKQVAILSFTRSAGWYYKSKKLTSGVIGSQLGHFVEKKYSGRVTPY